MIATDITQNAQKTLQLYNLCDACLGRLFKKPTERILNTQRGKEIRSQVPIHNKTNTCYLCEGLLTEIEHFAHLISDALQNYEYDTFLIGSKIDEDIIKKEQDLIRFTQSTNTDTLKMEINREIGKILEIKLKKTVDFKNPEITAVIDTAFNLVHLQIRPLFIYGRYKKFQRGIPQTRWQCRICRGKGCRSCSYTGQLYSTSVEELIAKKPLAASQGDEESFHGCGREDIDARMLGNGRPFVLEIKNPKKCSLNLLTLEKEINKSAQNQIEVSGLRFSDSEEVIRLKKATFQKKYQVVMKGENAFKKAKLKEVAQILQGTTIQQFTPTRVAHRRAHTIRERKVYSCTIESVEDSIARLTLETESGTYIKELISGDQGKTTPSISSLVGFPCIVQELDVIEIKGE